MVNRDFITLEEFEARIPWSMSTIRRRIRQGGLPAIQPGGKGTSWLINWTEFTRQAERSAGEHGSLGASTLVADMDLSDEPCISGPAPRWRKGLK